MFLPTRYHAEYDRSISNRMGEGKGSKNVGMPRLRPVGMRNMADPLETLPHTCYTPNVLVRLGQTACTEIHRKMDPSRPNFTLTSFSL